VAATVGPSSRPLRQVLCLTDATVADRSIRLFDDVFTSGPKLVSLLIHCPVVEDLRWPSSSRDFHPESPPHHGPGRTRAVVPFTHHILGAPF
jgi:hypothetical protein